MARPFLLVIEDDDTIALSLKVFFEGRGRDVAISVIVMTGYGEVEEAVKAMKLGAEYYFQKPIDLDELAVVVDKSLGIGQIRQEAALYRKPLYPIIGKSSQTQGLIHMINLLASNAFVGLFEENRFLAGHEIRQQAERKNYSHDCDNQEAF
jgi:DNA-binding NtrC family response regulator